MKKREMKSNFVNLWDNVLYLNGGEEIFETLERNYSGQDRHYHNMRHIAECLSHFRRIVGFLEKQIAVQLAIWFHDVVYDTHASDNEEKSAIMAYKALMHSGNKISEHYARNVSSLIMLTKHDKVPDSLDGRFLVDIDLAIFGKSYEGFSADSQRIRREYVNDENFKEGRIKVLKFFLEKPFIYYTDYFIERYEQRARENLQRSIEEFKKS